MTGIRNVLGKAAEFNDRNRSSDYKIIPYKEILNVQISGHVEQVQSNLAKNAHSVIPRWSFKFDVFTAQRQYTLL